MRSPVSMNGGTCTVIPVSMRAGLNEVVAVAFFTFVPTGTTFFFPRYLLPALPFFLLLVVSGCLAFLAFGRIGAFAAGALLAGVFAWQLYDVGVELDELRDLRMRALVSVTEQRQPALHRSTTILDLYEFFVSTEQFQTACGRISASYAW